MKFPALKSKVLKKLTLDANVMYSSMNGGISEDLFFTISNDKKPFSSRSKKNGIERKLLFIEFNLK